MKNSEVFKVAEITLSYRSKVQACDRPKVTSSRDAYNILLSKWSDAIEFIEEFNVLLINRANRVIGFYNLSKGGTAGTVVDAKIVFAAALKANACSIILAHNHPSGNMQPSEADIDLTRKLRKGAKLLDIGILDHLIMTPEGYYSFADEGQI